MKFSEAYSVRIERKRLGSLQAILDDDAHVIIMYHLNFFV